MPRRNAILIAVLGAPLLACVGWAFAPAVEGTPSTGGRQEMTVAAVSSVQQRLPAGANTLAASYVGAGGCAAAACHGDSTSTNPAWRSSYSRWITQRDPHSFAYAVLKSDTSKRILWLLDGGPSDPKAEKDKPWSTASPHRDNRCLTCHSIAPDAHVQFSDESLLADGVSCEACHGPAASWIESHTREGWLARGEKRYQFVGSAGAAERGNQSAANDREMWNTKDLVSRANVCVRCHVGGPDRDVNHNLIAAGHPRLNFEYHAFMANLPVHWNDSLDRERLQADPQSTKTTPPDYEARLWAIGQAATAQAALRLLDQRTQRSISAQSAASPEDVTSDRGWRPGPIAPAWPELAEYSCYSCHHDLNATRAPLRNPDQRTRALGSLPWGTWYFSELQSEVFSRAGASLPSLVKVIDPIRKAMEQRVALPKDVAGALADQRSGVASLSAAPHGRRISQSDIDQWLAAFRRLPPAESWDEATQRYLALNAWTKSHQRFAGETPQVNRILEEIREGLRFQNDRQSPSHLTGDRLAAIHKQFLSVLDLLKR